MSDPCRGSWRTDCGTSLDLTLNAQTYPSEKVKHAMTSLTAQSVPGGNYAESRSRSDGLCRRDRRQSRQLPCKKIRGTHPLPHSIPQLAGLMTKYDDVFYEPNLTDHGLPRNPFKSCVVPRPIGWISTLSTTGVANLAPCSSRVITLNELGTRNSKM
jgi:hypothetical protein